MTAEPRCAREAVQLHYFFDARRFGTEGSPLLELLWKACEQAGMNEPAASGGSLSLPAPDELRAGSGFRVLRERHDGSARRQAMLFRLHDMVGLTALFAADEGAGHTATESARALRNLASAWEQARTEAAAGLGGGDRAGDASLIGSVRINRSSAVPSAALPDGHRAAGEALWQELGGRTRVPPPLETPNRLALWELTREAGFPSARELLVTTDATDAQEELLDDWSWATPHQSLVPLTRYLLNAAVIRHQYRVRLGNAEKIHGRIERLTKQSVELTKDWTKLTEEAASASRTGRSALDQWEELATKARKFLAEERLAGTEAGGLRIMARTVEVAAACLQTLGADPRHGPEVLPSDEECRARLTDVINDDLDYFAVAREQMSEAARVATESAAQKLQGHQQYLSLIQTTVIGALLMTLTAVQALEYKLPLARGLQGPLIALLGSLSLSLPLLVVRRWRRGTGGRVGGALEIGAMAVTGAAVGWLAGSALGHVVIGVPAGAVLLSVAGVLLTRRSSP